MSAHTAARVTLSVNADGPADTMVPLPEATKAWLSVVLLVEKAPTKMISFPAWARSETEENTSNARLLGRIVCMVGEVRSRTAASAPILWRHGMAWATPTAHPVLWNNICELADVRGTFRYRRPSSISAVIREGTPTGKSRQMLAVLQVRAWFRRLPLTRRPVP